VKNKLPLFTAIILALGVASVAAPAYADIKPIPMPADARLVEFPFDPNDTFIVLSRPKAVTDIALHEDEDIVSLALGDTFQWQVKETKGHLFVKPIRPNISTSATLVTTARTYQFTLQASPEDGQWYQRVSFTYPQLLVIERKRQAAVKRAQDAEIARHDAEAARLKAQVVTPAMSPDSLNFDYVIKGEATFKPTHVFDDGKFTWVRMPKVQDMPAFFMISEDGSVDLINTHLQGDYVVVHRLLDKLLLKLGKTEIKVERNKSGWSFFR